jgi:fatty acid-binding protein DegV
LLGGDKMIKLSEMDFYDCLGNEEIKYVIKKNAIEDIKEYKKHIKLISKQTGKPILSIFLCSKLSGIIEHLMEKYEITEEDLKDEKR